MFRKVKTLTDITDPNKCYFYQKERYIEKKILSIIKQKEINEEKYNELYLLIHLNLYESALVCKDIWSNISSSYEEFKKQKRVIEWAIKERFSTIEAEFVYKNEHNSFIYLPANKMRNIDQSLKNKLMVYFSKSGFFDDFDFNNIRNDNQRILEQSGPRWRYMTLAEREQEQDAGRDVQVGEWDSDEHYQRNQEAKKFKNELDKLETLITLIRSISEYNDPKTFQEIELTLPEELLAVKVKAYGFELLSQTSNTLTKDDIQKKLDQYLLEETNPEKIAFWIKKGANINAVNEKGMTLLGIYLTKYISDLDLNIAITKLLDLGIDVNLGREMRSNKNNLKIALEKSPRLLSDEVVNRMIEKCKITTIDEATDWGSALHYAVREPTRINCIKKLINLGASLTTRSLKSGSTPLMTAAIGKHLKVVKLILKKSTETINHQNNDGNTALMMFIKNLQSDDLIYSIVFSIIDALILAGTNIDLVNKDGKNAKQLASKFESIEKQIDKSVEKLNSSKLSINTQTMFYSENKKSENKSDNNFSHTNDKKMQNAVTL